MESLKGGGSFASCPRGRIRARSDPVPRRLLSRRPAERAAPGVPRGRRSRRRRRETLQPGRLTRSDPQTPRGASRRPSELLTGWPPGSPRAEESGPRRQEPLPGNRPAYLPGAPPTRRGRRPPASPCPGEQRRLRCPRRGSLARGRRGEGRSGRPVRPTPDPAPSGPRPARPPACWSSGCMMSRYCRSARREGGEGGVRAEGGARRSRPLSLPLPPPAPWLRRFSRSISWCSCRSVSPCCCCKNCRLRSSSGAARLGGGVGGGGASARPGAPRAKDRPGRSACPARGQCGRWPSGGKPEPCMRYQRPGRIAGKPSRAARASLARSPPRPRRQGNRTRARWPGTRAGSPGRGRPPARALPAGPPRLAQPLRALPRGPRVAARPGGLPARPAPAWPSLGRRALEEGEAAAAGAALGSPRR